MSKTLSTLTKEIREQQLRQIGRPFRWLHSNFVVEDTIRIAPTKDRWWWLGAEQHWYDFDGETLKEIVEEYGHRG